jgi:outer membrane protein insertion porin family
MMGDLRKNLTACRFAILRAFFFVSLICLSSHVVWAQNKYEFQRIAKIDVAFEDSARDEVAAEQFRILLVNVLGDRYSSVKIREALQSLYDSGRIVSAKVEANGGSTTVDERVNLRFVIKRKTQAERVEIRVADANGETVTEEELLVKLNLLAPGNSVTDQTLRYNADQIQSYLRDRGYYESEVDYTTNPGRRDAQAVVTFFVKPGAQSRVENFDIDIKGFDAAAVSKVKKLLKLQPGALYSREALLADQTKIRNTLIAEQFLAPRLETPKVTYDPDKNAIGVSLKGEVSAKVKVTVSTEKLNIGRKTQTRLLPVKRDGSIDQSAIEEGRRRLQNHLQEKGYFFAEVEPLCSVTPAVPKDDVNQLENSTAELCQALSGLDLAGREAEIEYRASLNRRLKLVDIRLQGTDKFTVPEIISVLETQRATTLGFIPQFGYGRGYTSVELLEEDRQTILAFMRELGYRNARVNVRQGVSPEGENLIITFVVREGVPTRIAEVEIAGNKAFSTLRLQSEMPNLTGKNFSRARVRAGSEKLLDIYAGEGFIDAKAYSTVVELPKEEGDNEERVKIVYTVESEGKRALINRVLINGNKNTSREAILKAVPLRPGDFLRSADVAAGEQALYASDAFELIGIETEPAGETADGSQLRDVIINLTEKDAKILDFGGGYSTDLGPSGLVDFRHVNLFGRLQQGGFRGRVSQRQQLVQFDYLIPRFRPDGKDRFAPLSITAQYQRDSTVTRFFRSAFDRGTFGIVQRRDADGNPIDVFGARAGLPTINRFSLIAETQRTISRKDRSILFARYRFEDVRLFNIESLLIADLLRPDSKIRISGFGAAFARDTRANCIQKYTVLEVISKGEPGNPCRYSASEPTAGSFLTVDYNLSLEQLGANISFQKFQANYQTYFTLPQTGGTIFAGRATLGLANTWGNRTRFATGQFRDLAGTLPISERFYAGGSGSLRGFDFESAGPRVAVVPQGFFFNSQNQQVFLSPFTIPFGGNALAIANLEARIPLNKTFSVVPFYDGGNVFRRVSDLFKPPAVTAGDVFRQNLRALWTNTVGLGVRFKTPVGGSLAIDYGYLLNPPEFLIPQVSGPPTVFRLRQGQIHFRFSQIF